jgi:hypothetical protein
MSDNMGFATEIEDPLKFLRNNAISEEIIRPLAELLITDILVGSGRAKRLTGFRLGLSVHGMRPLTLSWETPKRYSNQPTAIRTIEGRVRL